VRPRDAKRRENRRETCRIDRANRAEPHSTAAATAGTLRIVPSSSYPLRKQFLSGDDVFTVTGLVGRERCRAIIADAEARGFDDAPITTAAGFVMEKSVRNNTRVMYDDPALASELWGLVAPFVPSDYRGWTAIGLNERFRIYRYDPGQHFKWHRDGHFARSAHERSRLTAMLYLNNDYQGGATEVASAPGMDPQLGQARIDVVPETGM
jgi:hypothetical protein